MATVLIGRIWVPVGRCAIVPNRIFLQRVRCEATFRGLLTFGFAERKICLDADYLNGYFLNQPVARQFLATMSKTVVISSVNQAGLTSMGIKVKGLPLLLQHLPYRNSKDYRPKTRRPMLRRDQPPRIPLPTQAHHPRRTQAIPPPQSLQRCTHLTVSKRPARGCGMNEAEGASR